MTSFKRMRIDGNHRLDFVTRYLSEVCVSDPGGAEVGGIGVS